MQPDVREVVKCPHCKLTQFRPTSDNCLRCKKALFPEQPVVVAAVHPALAAPSPQNQDGTLPPAVATVIKRMRARLGLSQRQLANRIDVPRTYVSKIENGNACPTLRSLEVFARGLNLGLAELVMEIEAHMLLGRVAKYQALNGSPA